jgi:hypothetical protein
MIEWSWVEQKDQLMYIYAVSAKDTKIKKIINFTIFVCLLSVLLNPYDIEVGCSTVIGKSLTDVTTEYDGTSEDFST